MSIVRKFLGKIKRNILAYHYLIKGKYFVEKGDIENALQAYRNAFNIRPNIPLLVYARLGDRISKLKDAKVNNLENLDDDEIDNLVHIGNIDKAVICARKIVDKMPLDHKAQITLGKVLECNKCYDESNAVFATAIALSGNYSETKKLDQMLNRIAPDNTVIITQLANNFFPIFEIWYSHFKKFQLKNLLVIALDSVVYERVRDMGIEVYLLPIYNYQTGIRHILWHETVKFRKKINDMGVNYIHTDIDAIWLNNPVGIINSLPGDIVSSIAYGVPPNVLKEWGFVMCLGFYAMRSSDATRRIYNKYIKYTQRYGHDQNGLNQLLMENEVIWRNREFGYKQGWCEQLCLNIDLIPDDVISRDPMLMKNETRPFVFHPLLEGAGIAGKIIQLRGYGL